MFETIPAVYACFFTVGLVYACTGHGGGSGYLAIMAIAALGSQAERSTSALLLNLLVAGSAWKMFWDAGHGSWRLLLPFLIASVPAAWLGGALRLDPALYQWMLTAALLAAAIRLLTSAAATDGPFNPPSKRVALPVGGIIGLISGMVGVGGGIFLSPLMILMRWADPKTTAAASAVFITLNSLAGLGGRMLSGKLAIHEHLIPLALAAWMGGLIGAHLGARRLPKLWLCRALAAALVIAPLKWLLR